MDRIPCFSVSMIAGTVRYLTTKDTITVLKAGKIPLYCSHTNQLYISTKPASEGYPEVIIPVVCLQVSYLVLKTLSLSVFLAPCLPQSLPMWPS